MNADLTVAVPTYNRPAAVARCVESLVKQTVLPSAIFVFDSSEEAGTENALKPYADRITYVHNAGRVILPAARNRCIEACKTKYIAFIDDDAVAKPSWVASIMKAFVAFPEAAGVTGPTINTTPALEPLEPVIHSKRNLNYILPWGEVRSDSRRWVPPAPVWCTSMPGGNMTFPVALLREVGGFDEELDNPSFREETDVEFRLLRAGHKFVYHPDVFVWHVPGIKGGISDVEDNFGEYLAKAGTNHRRVVDKYVPKLLSRASWILWSRNPPNLWLAFIATVLRRKNYLAWHKGLWRATSSRNS